MTALLPCLAWILSAQADPLVLVERAANQDLMEEDRMTAFNQAVVEADGASAALIRLAADPEGDSRRRWVAIRVLGRVNSPPAVETLLNLVADEQPAIRAAAAAALGDTRRIEVSGKVASLLQDPAMIVRSTAADALAIIGDPRSVPALVAALDDPSNTYRGASLWVRRHYIDTLGVIGSRTAAGALMGCLEDPDTQVVAASLQALERVTGVVYSRDRTREEQIEAWKRWWAYNQ